MAQRLPTRCNPDDRLNLKGSGRNDDQGRQQWQKQAAVGVLAHARCPDCPLDGGDRTTPCAIHDRWLDLLRRYAATEISSREYVEDSLKLLSRYKDRLKVGRTRRRQTVPILDPG